MAPLARVHFIQYTGKIPQEHGLFYSQEQRLKISSSAQKPTAIR
jgi:hypothetical protein